ncbi:MAG: TlyA family rRNA (cytidine-2'-O)-methyltransferase, partial [Rhodospirillales bacterium]|nr:TlyA family rRNA (cytidine-2'-O)-methyltransferase [Rhodospirillales bacterium]
VVSDPALHEEVCERISAWLSDLPGWSVIGATESPIRGPEGNVEFLIAAVRED